MVAPATERMERTLKIIVRIDGLMDRRIRSVRRRAGDDGEGRKVQEREGC